MNSPYTSSYNRGLSGLAVSVAFSKETSPLLGPSRENSPQLQYHNRLSSVSFIPPPHIPSVRSWHILVFLMIVVGACKRLAAKAVFNLGLVDPDFMTCSVFFSMSLILSLHFCAHHDLKFRANT